MPKIGREDFKERREARIERLHNGASARAAEAAQARAVVDQIGGMIPFGQPILVGHHSEGRHRRDLARIDANMRKSIELRQASAELQRRAAAAESNDAISSDDPEALTKLRAKLDSLNASRELMVKANKAIRGKNAAADLADLGFSEAQIAKLQTKDYLGRIGYANFELTNRGAEARRIAKRIADLEARASEPAREPVEVDGVRVVDEDNRVQIIFPGKPAEAIRDTLKSNGFHWSPRAGAWQRMTSRWAWHVACELIGYKAPSKSVDAPALPTAAPEAPAETDEDDDGRDGGDAAHEDSKAVVASIPIVVGARIDALRSIVASHSIGKVDGVAVDVMTANMLVGLFDRISRADLRERFERMSLVKLVEVGWKLTG